MLGKVLPPLEAVFNASMSDQHHRDSCVRRWVGRFFESSQLIKILPRLIKAPLFTVATLNLFLVNEDLRFSTKYKESGVYFSLKELFFSLFT